MRASDLHISSLNSYEAHQQAIRSIETDHRNTIGGMEAWNSGYQTYLTVTARKKIAAIEARIERLFPLPECES